MQYRIGADTHVLFSGLCFRGPVHELLRMVLLREAGLFLSQYIVDETKAVFLRRNRPEALIDALLGLPNVSVLSDDVYDSSSIFEEGRRRVRDAMDAPVFAFAAYALRSSIIDYFVTGDGDLLTPGVRKALGGRIMAPSDFLKLCETHEFK